MRFKSILSAGLLVAAAGMLAAVAPDDTKLAVGDEVTNFKLENTKGKTVEFDDFDGKTLVIEWYNPDCPWCRKVYDDGIVQDTMKAMEKMGDDYVYICINSTANKPKDKVIDGSVSFLEKHDVEIPVLIDYDGTVGKMFQAKTTPHMYVIDDEGVLRYSGAFTSDKTGKSENITNYVLNALEQIEAGETVSPDYVKPWGCGVKYAKNKG